MTGLKGKYALVTGGTSGIGLATVRRLQAEGATVGVTGRNATALADMRGGSLLTIESDAGDIADQSRVAEEIRKNWGRLDVLFCNAADLTLQPFEAWTAASFDRQIAVNLKGPFFLIQALLPLFSNPSSIILCGSVSAHTGFANNTVYAASKAGLLSLARTLSRELVGRGIRVNGLVPGATDTAALSKLGLPTAEEATLREQIAESVPLGRMGRAAELADAAVFLASEQSSFMVGTEIIVDGGASNLR